MVLARWQGTIVDDEGNVMPAASVEVRSEAVGARLAVLYSDRNGATPIGNPFPADADGFAAFHVVGGAYRITATSGAFSRTWRYVGIGLAAESDVTTTGVAYFFDPLTADADPGAGLLRLNNAALASVTAIYVDNLNAAGAAMSTWLNTFDDGGSSGDRGNILITAQGGASFLLGRVTGSVVDGTGYRKISVTVLSASGAFGADEILSLAFFGRGADGAGGVAISGTFETDALVQAASSTAIKTAGTLYTGDLDSLAGAATKVSMRSVNSGAINTPAGSSLVGSHVVTHVWDTNAARQIFIEFASTRMWTRSKAAAVWGAWSKIFNEQDLASDSEIRSAAAASVSNAKLIQASRIESASALVTLADAATLAFDWDAGINRIVDLAGNRTLANPTNGQQGTWRTILVRGNDATPRTLTFGNAYFGTLPVITTATNSVYFLVSIYCLTTGHFIPTAIRAL